LLNSRENRQINQSLKMNPAERMSRVMKDQESTV